MRSNGRSADAFKLAEILDRKTYDATLLTNRQDSLCREPWGRQNPMALMDIVQSSQVGPVGQIQFSSDRAPMGLTNRENYILAAASRGLIDREIGREFGITREMLFVYWRRIYRKFGCSSRAEAIALYAEHIQANSTESTCIKLPDATDGVHLSVETHEYSERDLLAATTTASVDFIEGSKPFSLICRQLLEDLLDIAGSESGCIGEVRYERNAPQLHVIAYKRSNTNDDEGSPLGGIVIREPKDAYGRLIRLGQPLVCNSPFSEMFREPLLSEDLPLRTFLGLPLYSGTVLVGVIGVEDRPSGYQIEEAELLRPVSDLCAAMISSRRD